MKYIKKLLAICAFIACSCGQVDSIPSEKATGVVKRRISAIGEYIWAFPQRDTGNGHWCGSVENLGAPNHCWTLQEASGSPQDSSDGWHLSLNNDPTQGATSLIPVRDATGWIEYTELGVEFGHEQGRYLYRPNETQSATNLVSVTAIFRADYISDAQWMYHHRTPGFFVGLMGHKLFGNVDNGSSNRYLKSYGEYDDGEVHCVTWVLDGRTVGAGKIYIDGYDDTDFGISDVYTGGSWASTGKSVYVGGYGRYTINGGLYRLRIDNGKAATLKDHLALCGHTTERVELYLLLGQSNMWGAANINQMPYSYRTLPSNVEYWRNGTKETVLNCADDWGPEVTFIHWIRNLRPEVKMVFVKRAAGGTCLYASWRREWVPSRAAVTGATQHMWPLMVEDAAAAIGARTVSRVGIVWFQGERDARYSIAADDYEDGLKYFVQCLREEYGDAAKFALARLNTQDEDYSYIDTVRAAQWGAPGNNDILEVIDIDDVPLGADGIHYGAIGQLPIGQRFAYKLEF